MWLTGRRMAHWEVNGLVSKNKVQQQNRRLSTHVGQISNTKYSLCIYSWNIYAVLVFLAVCRAYTLGLESGRRLEELIAGLKQFGPASQHVVLGQCAACSSSRMMTCFLYKFVCSWLSNIVFV